MCIELFDHSCHHIAGFRFPQCLCDQPGNLVHLPYLCENCRTLVATSLVNGLQVPSDETSGQTTRQLGVEPPAEDPIMSNDAFADSGRIDADDSSDGFQDAGLAQPNHTTCTCIECGRTSLQNAMQTQNDRRPPRYLRPSYNTPWSSSSSSGLSSSSSSSPHSRQMNRSSRIYDSQLYRGNSPTSQTVPDYSHPAVGAGTPRPECNRRPSHYTGSEMAFAGLTLDPQ